MENKNLPTGVTASTDGVVMQPSSEQLDVVPTSIELETDALSQDPTRLTEPPPVEIEAIPKQKTYLSFFKRADVILALLVVAVAVAGLAFALFMKKSPVNSVDVTKDYGSQRIPLEVFSSKGGDISFAESQVTINGALTVNEGLVIAPSVQPNAPVSGQLYFDTNTNQLAYYNGTGYVALTEQGAVVQSIGGATGPITLGGNLSIVGNQLSASLPQPTTVTNIINNTTTGVSSFGGATGAITLGNGLAITGNAVRNSGVLTLTAGTPNLSVATDGNGNLTISNVGGGSGTVTSGGGTTGRIAKFTGVQNVEDSLLSESGSTVTVNGSLSVTNALALATALTVSNGGIGTNILPSNGVLVGNGTSAVTGVTAAGAGLCLLSTAGAPAFQSCPTGTNVMSLNGLTGTLSIANATGSVNTITIDDAGTSTKGIASFNGTNFTVVGGAVNTAQNIGTTATPTFSGVNTNAINPSSTLTIGASGQTLNLVGGAGTTLVANGGGFATTLGFSGSPTGAVTYNLDRAASPGTYDLCSTAGNCVGLGGTVSSTGGTTNRLSKFSGAQSVVDSSVSDNGSTVTVNGTANLVVQGGTTTLGTLTQAGTLVISDGSSNTISIVSAPLAANRLITLPDAGGDATLCLDSGNCIGGTGGAPNTAAYLVATLNGTLTNERALAGGTNVTVTDGGAGGNMTVATVSNPTFSASVTTPILQSSGALTITSAAGNVIAIDAGTTIELQDSTNVTGSLDVSVALNVGSSNAFQVDSSGAIAAATGITSSGTIVFSGLNCTGNANGGVLTTNGSGQLVCDDDDGGAGGAISGSGASGTIPVFTGTQTIANSIITQSGTTITIAGTLSLNNALSVANGGTGATTLTTRGLLYGNGTGAVQATAAGTSGQVLVADGSGVPTFVSFSGDVAVSATGTTTIQADSVALGTDTTGNYVGSLGTLTGLSTTGNTGEGSTPTLSVLYGSIANTAVQGNVSLTCPSGAGNLTGGGTGITLGTGGTCADISIVDDPTFGTSVTTPSLILSGAGSNGTIQVGTLGQGTVYTLPDPGGATTTICIATGNCSAAGSAGGDLTGTYPNPTIASLQGTNLSITSPVAGHILVYNGTNGQWENRAISGDIAISESGAVTIQANSVALGTDTTGNYVLGLTAGNGASVTGSAGEGWTPTVSVLYGSSANTAVQGDTSITVTAGTNLTGGGSITLGSGGSVTVNVANSPTFSGTLTVQGATATIGTAAVAGSVVLSDGSSNTGALQTASLGQDTTYTLPDPGAGSATICLSTGNCAGSGSGVTTVGGSTNQLAKFTGSQAIGDSSISDDGSTVTLNGTANLVVQGGTATLGTLTQAGTLDISDGSSNTVSIVASGLAANHTYTLPDVGGDASFCLSTGNCIGGGGGGAPNDATYLVASLNGTLTNERALAGGTNINLTDGGAGGSMTVATVNNPTFSSSVTTPALQSSGALVLSSAAGTTVAIDAGTTIELQDSTNVTGSLDVSVSLNVGTANAFQVSSGGAISAATGITSSGTITFSGLDCSSFANGGALTANGSGVLSCSDDDGGAAGAISGSGTSGTVPVFSGASTIADSIITQAATTISIAGDLSLGSALTVANGGTGATTFTTRGLLYGNGTGAVQVTAAGTGGQVLIANASGVPTFASFSGDVAVSNTGVTTIQANSVALGTDTTGNYVATLGTLTGLSTTGNTGEGSTPTLSVQYGSSANTAVQGNTTITCPSGTGNLNGGGTSITLGAGGTCSNIGIVNNPTFSTSVTTPLLTLTGAGSNGSLQVATLGQTTTYTLPDPATSTATICISTGNCVATGTAGGDLTGSYPNPTIAKLQNGTLTITSVASGNILQYDGSAWVNQSVSGDIALSNTGVATIQNNAVTSAKINNGTIVNADLASGSFTNITTVGTLTSLTVTGATAINTTGTANTAIGNATGSFQVTSSGLNVSTGGALTGVSGITTNGGYTQSGTTANTLTGATSLTAAGTALSVTNNASIGGTLGVNTITPTGALTVGATGQSFTLQGNGTSTITATNAGSTTTLGFVTPTANATINFPALSAGTYTLCTSSGNCAGAGATLQTAYNFSTNPELVLDATRGALTIRDASTPLGANLLEVQSNNGGTTYFNVTATGTNTTGVITGSGNINTTGGTLQTNSTTRVDNSGNLTNIGNITSTGTVSHTYSATTGTGATLAVTNSAASGTTTVVGQAINITGTNNAGGSNTTTGLNFGNVAAATNNTYYGINFGTGLTDLVRYNGTQLLSGTGKLQNAAIDATLTYSNLQKVGALDTGSLVSGFGTINIGSSIATTSSVQGGTGTFTGASSLTLGTASSNLGSILFKTNSSANTLTLSAPTIGGARAISFPDASGTVCLQSSSSCGFVAGAASDFVQNQNSSQQASSNFWISGTGRADTSVSTPQITTASGNLTLQPATGVVSLGGSDTFTANGGFSIFSGSNSNLTVTANGTGTLNLGTNAASSRIINIGATGSQANTSTINIGNSTGAAQTVSIGSTNGASATTISAGTGNLLLQTNSASAAVTVKSSTNSTTAFQVQNASSATLLGIDTVNNVVSVNTGAGATLNTWAAQSNALTTGASFGSSVVANGYIYAIGGYGNAYHGNIQYAPLKSDGTTGTWATTTALPASRAFMMSSVVTYGEYMYVVGGSADATNGVNTVYYAKLHSDGTVGSWNTATNLPGNRLGPSVVTYHGRMYVLGGGTTGSAPTNTIFYATINSDGSLSSWTQDGTTLPVTFSNATATVANGKVYYLGGTNAGGTSQTAVNYATIDPATGDVGSFTSTSSLPTATSSSIATLYNGYIYIVNGGTATYYYAQVTSAGALGSWSSQISMSPFTARTGTPSAMYNGYFYAVSGFTGGSGQTSVYTTSTARTKIGGALDLVGASDGVVGGDGSVGGSLTAGDTNVVGSLTVQGQTNLGQDLAVNGNATVQSKTNNSSAFSVLNASNVPLFNIDTSNGRVYIGSTTPDAVGALLVLDNHDSDPTGVSGGMYYSSSTDKFRCYEESFWKDCIDSARTGIHMIAEMFNSLSGDTLQFASSGTGSSVSEVSGSLNPSHPGIVSMNTGTTTTGWAGAIPYSSTGSQLILGNGDSWRMEAELFVPTLSDATNRYELRAGLKDTLSATDTDGCMFRYLDSTSSQWQGICAAGGTTSSPCSTGITVTANTWYRLTVDVNSAGTSADFYVDGVYKCSVTTNIPTSSGQTTAWGVGIRKTAGTTARTVSLDYMEVWGHFGTPR